LLLHRTEEPRPVAELRPDVSRDVRHVLRKMTAKAPSQRFQTAAAVAEALAPLSRAVKPAAPWAAARPPAVSDSLTPRMEQLTPRTRRPRSLLLAVGALGAIIALLAAWGVTFLTRAPATGETQQQAAAVTPLVTPSAATVPSVPSSKAAPAATMPVPMPMP